MIENIEKIRQEYAGYAKKMVREELEQNFVRLNLNEDSYREQIKELEQKIIMTQRKNANLIIIAFALDKFKLKLYERMQTGFKDLKEFQDFILENAPCNYDLNRI